MAGQDAEPPKKSYNKLTEKNLNPVEIIWGVKTWKIASSIQFWILEFKTELNLKFRMS